MATERGTVNFSDKNYKSNRKRRRYNVLMFDKSGGGEVRRMWVPRYGILERKKIHEFSSDFFQFP